MRTPTVGGIVVALAMLPGGSACKSSSCDADEGLTPNGGRGVLWVEPTFLGVQDGMRATLLVPRVVEKQHKSGVVSVYVPSVEITRGDGGTYAESSEIDVRKSSEQCPDGPLQRWSYSFDNATVEGEGRGSHVFVGASVVPNGVEVVLRCDVARGSSPTADLANVDPGYLTLRVRDATGERYADDLRAVCLQAKTLGFGAMRPDGTAIPRGGVVRVGDELVLSYGMRGMRFGAALPDVELHGEDFLSADDALEIVAPPRTTAKGVERRRFRVRAAKPLIKPRIRAGALEAAVDLEIQI